MDCTLHFYQPVQWVPKLLVNVSGWVVWRAKYGLQGAWILFCLKKRITNTYRPFSINENTEKGSNLKADDIHCCSPSRSYWISYKIQTSTFVVAVVHIDQRMEPKDRAFQVCIWPLQGIYPVRFMYRSWMKHDAFLMPLAIQQQHGFISLLSTMQENREVQGSFADRAQQGINKNNKEK